MESEDGDFVLKFQIIPRPYLILRGWTCQWFSQKIVKSVEPFNFVKTEMNNCNEVKEK